MEDPSIHIRVAYVDKTQWTGVYSVNEAPTAITNLIEDTKNLAKQMMREQTSDTIDDEIALTFLEPEKNLAQKDSPSIIVKVIVHHTGKISANGQEVSLSDLKLILDDLKQKNGAVWYYRELPDEEPSDSLEMTKKV